MGNDPPAELTDALMLVGDESPSGPAAEPGAWLLGDVFALTLSTGPLLAPEPDPVPDDEPEPVTDDEPEPVPDDELGPVPDDELEPVPDVEPDAGRVCEPAMPRPALSARPRLIELRFGGNQAVAFVSGA
jgi:hypothetical protein